MHRVKTGRDQGQDCLPARARHGDLNVGVHHQNIGDETATDWTLADVIVQPSLLSTASTDMRDFTQK